MAENQGLVLDKHYFITADTHNFILKKKQNWVRKRRDDRPPTQGFEVIGYYQTLSQAVKAYTSQRIKEEMQEDIDINALIQKMDDIEKEIQKYQTINIQDLASKITLAAGGDTNEDSE